MSLALSCFLVWLPVPGRAGLMTMRPWYSCTCWPQVVCPKRARLGQPWWMLAQLCWYAALSWRWLNALGHKTLPVGHSAAQSSGKSDLHIDLS